MSWVVGGLHSFRRSDTRRTSATITYIYSVTALVFCNNNSAVILRSFVMQQRPAWICVYIEASGDIFYTTVLLSRPHFTMCGSLWYTVIQKNAHDFHVTSFYKCWPIFIIFGQQYAELMCNITVIYLSTSPTYCRYTTLENIGHSSKGLTRQKSHVDAQKLMPYLCQDARASFSSILALRLITIIIATSYWCSRCCHPFVPLLVTLTSSNKALHQTVELLQCETPKFIAPDWWPSNRPDLHPVDYRMWSVMHDRVYQTPVRDVTDLKQRLTNTWNGLLQSIVDDAVDEWWKRLRGCVKEKGGHFEHYL